MKEFPTKWEVPLPKGSLPLASPSPPSARCNLCCFFIMLIVFLSTMHNTSNTTLWISFCHVVSHLCNRGRADSWCMAYTVSKEEKNIFLWGIVKYWQHRTAQFWAGLEHIVVFGGTPAIFPVDFVLREDGAVIIHSLYKAIAIWQSVL